MKQYTYLYEDPKTGVLRYVGKGDAHRPASHLKKSSNRQLHNLLQKRISEGYNPRPILIEAATPQSSAAMEIFWIAVIGREDLGLGSLFNKTNGGEGVSGKVFTEDERKMLSKLRTEEHRNRSERTKSRYSQVRTAIAAARTEEQKLELNKKIAESTKQGIQALSEEQRAASSAKKASSKTAYHRTMSPEAKAQRAKNISAGMARRRAAQS